MNNKQKGEIGEKLAINYLLSKGAEILESNYRIKFGEIDIITKLNNQLVFVEVKSRTNLNYGYPAEAVNNKKKNKIVGVAKYYILKNRVENIPVRFDVIEVYLRENKVNHIINAF